MAEYRRPRWVAGLAVGTLVAEVVAVVGTLVGRHSTAAFFGNVVVFGTLALAAMLVARHGTRARTLAPASLVIAGALAQLVVVLLRDPGLLKAPPAILWGVGFALVVYTGRNRVDE